MVSIYTPTIQEVMVFFMHFELFSQGFALVRSDDSNVIEINKGKVFDEVF